MPEPKSRYGGQDRTSTKSKFAHELQLLGELLTATRQNAGLKQSDVAFRLGLPASYLSKIENGTRRVDVIELVQIGEAIGVGADEIVRQLMEALRSAGALSATR